MTDLRTRAIEQITKQFEETQPISQDMLDLMIAARQAANVPDETIQELVDSVTVGKTRFVYFLLEDPAGDSALSILKITAVTIDEAVATLENIGTFTFIEGLENVQLPRLRKRA